jgi:hypothetical protein
VVGPVAGATVAFGGTGVALGIDDRVVIAVGGTTVSVEITAVPFCSIIWVTAGLTTSEG